MKVYIGSDHTGLQIKDAILAALREKGTDIEDCGALQYDKDDDYPDFVSKVAEKVSLDPENTMGIFLGGSGQGEAIAANKFKGVRCALFYTKAVPEQAADITGRMSSDPFEVIRLTREHNNANMLSLSARFLKQEDAIKATELFLETPFPGDERHKRRIDKIAASEK